MNQWHLLCSLYSRIACGPSSQSPSRLVEQIQCVRALMQKQTPILGLALRTTMYNRRSVGFFIDRKPYTSSIVQFWDWLCESAVTAA